MGVVGSQSAATRIRCAGRSGYIGRMSQRLRLGRYKVSLGLFFRNLLICPLTRSRTFEENHIVSVLTALS